MLVLDGGRAYRGDQGGYNLAVSNHAVLFGSSYSSPTFSICETDVISRRTVSGAATSTCCRRSARGPARRTGSTRRGRVSPDADKLQTNRCRTARRPSYPTDVWFRSACTDPTDATSIRPACNNILGLPDSTRVSALPYNHRSSDFTTA